MLDLLNNKVSELVSTLVEPIWKRILGLSWIGQFVILLVMLGLMLVGTHLEQAASSAGTLANLARVSWARDSQIPLRTSLVTQVQDTAQRIATSLEADLGRPGEADTQPWPIAQATVASLRVVSIDVDSIREFLRASEDRSCSCWRDFPGKFSFQPRNIPASSWVIFALAEIDTQATSGEIDFLLSEQQSEGWWAIFPVEKSKREHASTYGTALALLALQNQLSKKLISGSDALRVSTAISNGASWLIAKREPRARWKDYPLNPSGKVSESISGLVLYALHTVSPGKLGRIDQEWLDSLPSSPPSASDADKDYYWIESKDGTYLDGYVQVKLPWMLIATVDAYPSGNTLQRASALQWLRICAAAAERCCRRHRADQLVACRAFVCTEVCGQLDLSSARQIAFALRSDVVPAGRTLRQFSPECSCTWSCGWKCQQVARTGRKRAAARTSASDPKRTT